MVPDEHPACVSRREFELWCAYHMREHQTHGESHDREHELTTQAITKADTALEKRLEGMNEFRASLKDQSAAFLTRDVYEVQHADLARRVDNIAERLQQAERWEAGINGRTIGVSAAIGIAVVIITLALKFVP